MEESILILDFGSQYTQLIARRVRELRVFSRILPFNASFSEIQQLNPSGIILSGGPCNVYQKGAPICDKRIFDLGIPVLGICYGMQLMAHLLGGRVKKTDHREYGSADVTADVHNAFFKGLTKKFTCWMSHGDRVLKLPKGFRKVAHTSNSPIAVIANTERNFFGVQFHPEVVHTPQGKQIIENFLYAICQLHGTWTPASFVRTSVKEIKDKVGKDKVVLGLSGGVDSSVAAVLLHKAIGKQLTCIFVDNGLLRLNEVYLVKDAFKKHIGLNLRVVDARREFLKALKGVVDPEKKRKIIGRLFIKVFDREAHKIKNVKYLGQGTLYPDVIESVSVFGGPSSTIKSHHNVGGLPKQMKLKLIEPLRELFKDEVRAVGRQLKINSFMTKRHPFPGPGLAVRILGEITEERLDLLRKVDHIFIEEIKVTGQYDKIWQAFAVLLPVKTVGVMGDERTYEHVAALRAVTSTDGMTADWARIPDNILSRISNRIINEVKGINRVCYDISSKPPATIEWE